MYVCMYVCTCVCVYYSGHILHGENICLKLITHQLWARMVTLVEKTTVVEFQENLLRERDLSN